MVNPMWGYAWKFFLRWPADHFIFDFLNFMAWTMEILGAILMMIPFPVPRFVGGMIISLSFVFVGTQIRLGTLAWQVALCGLLFFDPRLISTITETSAPSHHAILDSAFSIFLWTYLILRPISVFGLWYNFFGKKRLPGRLQTALEKYTNFFGIILWRVFTADVTNFFIEIERDGKKISHYDRIFDWRFNQVCESITIACIFTTLKYYANQPALFRERILRYAKSLPPGSGPILFRYFSITKKDGRFTHVPVVEYEVNLEQESIRETVLDSSIRLDIAAASSPVHEAVRPGSYAPAKA